MILLKSSNVSTKIRKYSASWSSHDAHQNSNDAAAVAVAAAVGDVVHLLTSVSCVVKQKQRQRKGKSLLPVHVHVQVHVQKIDLLLKKRRTRTRKKKKEQKEQTGWILRYEGSQRWKKGKKKSSSSRP